MDMARLIHENLGIRVYGINFICGDGDEVMVTLQFTNADCSEGMLDDMAVACISGIGASHIVIDTMDWGVFAGIYDPATTQTAQALSIAEFLCRKLGCEPYDFEQGAVG